MCLYAISFTVFEADLQIYWLPVLLFFTVTSIIMFFVFMGNIYFSLQGFILPSIGVSGWSIAHC